MVRLVEVPIQIIQHAAQLHDIGNIGIPDAILDQAGSLSDDERTVMQQHTVLGHEVLQDGSGLLHLSAEIAKWTPVLKPVN